MSVVASECALLGHEFAVDHENDPPTCIHCGGQDPAWQDRQAAMTKSTLPEHSRFTLVFEGDLRKYNGNPFLTDTPFGRPVAVSVDDATKSLDALALLDDPRLRQALGYLEDFAADEVLAPVRRWIVDRDNILAVCTNGDIPR